MGDLAAKEVRRLDPVAQDSKALRDVPKGGAKSIGGMEEDDVGHLVWSRAINDLKTAEQR